MNRRGRTAFNEYRKSNADQPCRSASKYLDPLSEHKVTLRAKGLFLKKHPMDKEDRQCSR